MERETTAEREHAREVDCAPILGNKNEFPFISQSVSTLAAGLALWHRVESREVYDFILADKVYRVWSEGQSSWYEFGVCLIYIVYYPN